MNNQEKLILVTGASGFIALNVIQQLSQLPHRVRATLRNLKDEKKLEIVRKAATGSKHPIEIVSADLLKADTWNEACKGVDIVLHLASPFPSETPQDPENNLLKPAIEGTKNVLNAAHSAKVSRVVVTSSCAAVYISGEKNKKYTEKDWNNPEAATPYVKSKILAEKFAWDFVEEKKKRGEKCFELAVINPCFVLGPSLGDLSSLGTSEKFIADFMLGNKEKANEFYVGHCDVRDVALAHLKAAFLPQAAGHRHIIETKWASSREVFDILKKNYANQGYKFITQFEKGDDPNNKSDTTRMTKVLGVPITEYEKTIIDMAESLIKSGSIKKQ
ncbi:NADPH-dependent aldehyde reductase ARI1-like isoform X1 [Brachionus plicatilis]|uniref:NADPH-dependent aldehyde reductase ARI1-like isoform X1 n=1 Tax=Brachionus plicatilis TaxID=10195 RepID=A0A3M7QMU1_BRAPC|nr:NADPH-dependent aldehyde reductase ARI1-like isoform X1 [Brachionus plicatilis]